MNDYIMGIVFCSFPFNSHVIVYRNGIFVTDDLVKTNRIFFYSNNFPLKTTPKNGNYVKKYIHLKDIEI